MDKRNTSQDPDYVGPTGHEKKFHKTHFGVLRTLKKSRNSRAIWVRTGIGKYRLARNNEKQNEEKNADEKNDALRKRDGWHDENHAEAKRQRQIKKKEVNNESRI